MLDTKGRPLNPNPSDIDYLRLFSVEDIFQGRLGDCFMIAAILGITSNKELLSHLIPKDNAYRRNMKTGVYHFRLWRLGDWYDVVVDDYLPVDNQYNIIFTRNLTHTNEYWVSLFEKSVGKY